MKEKRKTLVKEFRELVKEGDTDKIKAVFDKCDINAYGGYNKGNALDFELSHEMMQWLIEQGADIDYVDRYGNTPLLYHAGHGFGEAQAISLVQLGANVHAVSRMSKDNALHYAVSAGSLELVKCLLDSGTDINGVNIYGDTPLEGAFHGARTFDIIKYEPVARYLLEHGVSVTERLKQYMSSVAKDIEFRRADLNQENIDKLDAALTGLYELFGVEPVPKRTIYDGKSKIVVKETKWERQHGELWDLLVPGSGHANTVQGEVIRISGKLGYEILDNGALNWDGDYVQLAEALRDYLHMGNPLKEQEYKELDKIFKAIKSSDETEINRMTELSVAWVLLNLDPILLNGVTYRR